MSDLSTQLREYLDATAPPVGLEEILTDEVWVPATDAPRQWRLTFPGWAYGVAAIVVVLALAVGLALLVPGVDETDVVDEPTPTTITKQPAPDLSGSSGSLDTPLGPITWIHATDIGLFPHLGVIQTPSGFAGVTEVEGSNGQLSLWLTSADGLTWTETAFPVQLDPRADVQLGETHERSWLTDGARLWLSNDGAVWAEIDLSDVTPPPSVGVEWFQRLEHQVVSEDVALFQFQLTPELPLPEIFDPESEFTGGVYRTNCGWDWELEACQDVADDVDVVFGVDGDTGEETLLARFHVEEAGATAHLVDSDTGRRLHEYSVSGVSGEQLTGEVDWTEMVLVGQDRAVEIVGPPWSAFGLGSVFIVDIQDRFIAYVDNSDPHGPTTLDEFEVWESQDGLNWTSRGIVDFGIGDLEEMDLNISVRGDHLIAHINHFTGQSFPSDLNLISTDGLNWEPYAPDEPDIRLAQIEGGLVSFSERAVFVSEDGDRWEELISWNPSRGHLAFIAGDTLVVALESDFTFDVWAFDLQP